MPGARCTRSLVCAIGSKYAHEYSQRAIGKHPTFPHAMVYGLYVISPVIGFLVTVACQRFANLMPASRHQDHTTSPSAHAPVVCSTFASTASRPASVTIARAPLFRDGTAKEID